MQFMKPTGEPRPMAETEAMQMPILRLVGLATA
jgi:hypothetical protein